MHLGPIGISLRWVPALLFLVALCAAALVACGDDGGSTEQPSNEEITAGASESVQVQQGEDLTTEEYAEAMEEISARADDEIETAAGALFSGERFSRDEAERLSSLEASDSWSEDDVEFASDIAETMLREFTGGYGLFLAALKRPFDEMSSLKPPEGLSGLHGNFVAAGRESLQLAQAHLDTVKNAGAEIKNRQELADFWARLTSLESGPVDAEKAEELAERTEAACRALEERLEAELERGVNICNPGDPGPDSASAESGPAPATVYATPAPEVGYADLEAAIGNSDAERVRYLLQAGLDVTETGPVGNILPFAIVRGNDEVVRILLEAGADPNATDSGGRSSLELAITFDKTEVVRMLANAGADVNEIVSGRLSVGGEDTVLGWAVKASGNLEIIRILVDAGADVLAKSEPFGQSTVEIAVERGNAEIIEILRSAADRARPPGSPGGLTAIPRGTDIDLSWRAPSEDGGSPVLGYRIEVSDDGSNWEVVVADTGSDDTGYTHTGPEGAGARHYRVSAINAAGVGQHVSATTEELCGMWESLHAAIVTLQAAPVVQCVIRELGADVNATDDDGLPVLYWAILVGTPEVVQVLVDAGADANATDNNGQPMLYSAILEGSPEIVRLLVEAGADVNATDASQGLSMLRWAIVKDNPEIVRILTEAGAQE